ncbi:MAG: PH domain-containing protein [Acutalibacteraceae bacterium]|jgi:uncharacterized membrane protein YdbT with pleckstrin-like domain
MKKRRASVLAAHPVQGLSTFLRLSWLLLIPLLQRAVLRPETLWESLGSLLNAALLLVLISVCSVWQWRSTRFSVVRNRLLFRRGIWRREEFLLPFSQVDGLSVTFSPLSALFGAGLLELETGAATREPDCSVFLSTRRLQSIMNRFLPQNRNLRFRCGIGSLLICALSWSNAASGLLVAAPFVQKAGQVFGREVQQLLLEQLNPGMRLVSVGVPPLAAAIAWILLLGWAAAFLRQFLACTPFSCSFAGAFIMVRCGMIPKRLRLFRTRRMAAVTVRQTLLMRICGVSSLLAHVPGDERQKDCRPLLVAAARQKAVEEWMYEIISPVEGSVLHPPARAKHRYLLPVFWPLMLTALLLILIRMLRAPGFVSVLLFPVLIFFLWRALVRFAEIPFAALELDAKTFRLSRMQGLSLLCTCVDRKNITGVRIRRTWFQRRAGLCTVDIFLRGKKVRRCSVRHLDFAELCRVLKKYGEIE